MRRIVSLQIATLTCVLAACANPPKSTRTIETDNPTVPGAETAMFLDVGDGPVPFAFSIPCGGGVVVGTRLNIHPVIWKVPGQPDRVVHHDPSRTFLIESIAACGTGVVASTQNFNNDTYSYYSPTCENLLGGGATLLTHQGRRMGVLQFQTDPRGGVRIAGYNNQSGPKVAKFYSPDCLNPLGGGRTEVIQAWREI